MKYFIKHSAYLYLILILVLFSSCLRNEEKINEILRKPNLPSGDTRLFEIQERGRLIAATDYNSISYFVYRGEPMGYQYEMLKQFAEFLDVKLEIIVENDLERSFELLNKDKIDLIAMSLTVTKERN
jgi:membrane-bound lytic murein transglycosylase F